MLARLRQLPVALRKALLLPPGEPLLRRYATYGAVQPDVAVTLDVSCGSRPIESPEQLFQAKFTGKINILLAAVDELLPNPVDDPTIGAIRAGLGPRGED